MKSELETRMYLRMPGVAVVSTMDQADLVTQGLEALGIPFATLDASDPEESRLARMLPHMKRPGTVVIYNFHALSDEVQASFSDFMKLAADEQDMQCKVIALGDENTPYSLVRHSPDLCLRMHVLS